MRHMRIDAPHHLFLLPSIILGMESKSRVSDEKGH